MAKLPVSRAWLNVVLPLAASGANKGLMLARLPLPLKDMPDVLPKTPPFIDRVAANSAAHRAGLRPDDLVLLVNDHVVGSCKLLLEELSFVDRLDAIRITVQRGQELIEVTLQAPDTR